MFNQNNTTLVIQGNCYDQWTIPFIEEYKKYFSNIILSTWDDENIHIDGIKIIKNQYPAIRGPGNVNCQLKSSLIGCQAAETEFVIKVRTDILIRDPESWLTFFSNLWKPNRIFVLGLSTIHLFSPRDQIFAGHRQDMIDMFDIPYINSNYAPTLDVLYPEIHIGARYYSKFSDQMKKFINDPNSYLLANAPKRHETIDEWNKIGHEYLYPVPRSLKYSWYKRLTNGEYNYDETAKNYGEYWHEDIIQKLSE